VWAELQTVKVAVEREFLDMQDVEFSVDEGQLYLLQTRPGKRTPWAALQIAVDLVRTGLIDPLEALQRLSMYRLEDVSRQAVAPGAGHPVARATGAVSGVVTGRLVFDSQRAQQYALTHPVILARPEISTDDFAGLTAAAGVVSTLGGRTSHAVVIARERGRVCLVGCAELRVDEGARACSFGAREFQEGDVITLDGESGLIYAGCVPVVVERPTDALAAVAAWHDHARLTAPHPGAGCDAHAGPTSD
jgi:pyruvate,orthophosphate dikinase